MEAYEMKIKLSIGVKLYIFIIITVLAVAIGTAFLAYSINANQIDRYYKQVAFDSAVNFSSFVDGDYLRKLRIAAETDEFQTLRESAEESDDEAAIQDYLEKNSLWEGYSETRGKLVRYLRNMTAIKYLYIVVCGDENAEYECCNLCTYLGLDVLLCPSSECSRTACGIDKSNDNSEKN